MRGSPADEMPKRSAGLLAYRRSEAGVEVLLVHPGGPYWRRKDDGAWSIPKGEHDPDEDPLEVAVREFTEELGVDPPDVADAVALGEVRQPGGKFVQAWAIEGDVDVSDVRSNTFELEWPPRSGRTQEFPEVDRAEWLPPEDARRKILRGQVPFLDRLDELLQP
jgi:predicted NUDIX family NTP pyrophosphohydrolase